MFQCRNSGIPREDSDGSECDSAYNIKGVQELEISLVQVIFGGTICEGTYKKLITSARDILRVLRIRLSQTLCI